MSDQTSLSSRRSISPRNEGVGQLSIVTVGKFTGLQMEDEEEDTEDDGYSE
jgi:hypothetical protein